MHPLPLPPVAARADVAPNHGPAADGSIEPRAVDVPPPVPDVVPPAPRPPGTPRETPPETPPEIIEPSLPGEHVPVRDPVTPNPSDPRWH